MQIAYANAGYPQNDTRGKSAKIRQIVGNVQALGHQVFLWYSDGPASAQRLPRTRIGRLRQLRQMDAILVLIEASPPVACKYGLTPYRQLFRSPVIAWEFNTVPEFQLILGKSETELQKTIADFKHFGEGCNLAICVSKLMTDYVKNNLGIQSVVTIPNGSDPELFCPNLPPVPRIERGNDRFNIVWIGSADLRWQNFELLRSAAEILWQRGKEHMAFHIIGSQFGLMRHMPPNVHYYGAEEYAKLPNWLAAMDVGLCLYYPGPADYGSPLKLFDYMASGLTVVGTNQPQTYEVFEQLEQPDLIIHDNDPGLLADILVRLEMDRDLVRKQGQAGRQLVIDFYNWRRVAQDMLSAIETVRKESNFHYI